MDAYTVCREGTPVKEALDTSDWRWEQESGPEPQMVDHHVPSGLVMLDAQCVIRSLDPAAERITGYTAEDVIGERCCEALCSGEVCRECAVGRVLFSGKVESDVIVGRTRAGDPITLERVAVPMLEDGRVEGVLEIVTDITEKQRLEEQLIQTEQMAARGKMAAEVGHEMNNYLAKISGHVQLLDLYLKRDMREQVDKSLHAILEGVDQIALFIQGLMEFSNLRTGRSECSLNRLIERLILFIKPQNRFDRIEFITHLDGRIPLVHVDASQIQQVLLHLFDNAVDAMGERNGETGLITVCTQYIDVQRSVHIRVADEGPGIPDDIADRVFDLHFSTKEGNNGLGLTIARSIVEDHGGTITLEREPDKGATFVVQLPIEDV